MEKAFLNSYQNFKNDNNHILELKKYFIKNVKKEIDGIKFNANCDDLENSSSSIVNICLPISNERSLLLDFNLLKRDSML